MPSLGIVGIATVFVLFRTGQPYNPATTQFRGFPMKKRHEEWLKLTGNRVSAQVDTAVKPIRMLSLPGFQTLEDKLLLYTPRRGELPPQVSGYVDHLSQTTFGTTENDTLFDLPDEYDDLPDWSEERHQIEDRWEAHEAQFETEEADEDMAISILLRLGLDFRDDRGRALRCTKLLCRQAEAAAKGIMGRMPDRATAGLDSWTKALERDAKQHMMRKRAG